MARSKDPPSEHGTGRTIALVLDAMTAIPWFWTAPLVRSWHLRWGATADEVRSAMPGDDVIPRAQFNATRAITVDAPPERVWPWIVQLGYGRAGFYTYDLIDNASQRAPSGSSRSISTLLLARSAAADA